MTDLTEQWKKGELPSGWYWCECTAGFYQKPVDLGCYGCYGFQEAQEALKKINGVI